MLPEKNKQQRNGQTNQQLTQWHYILQNIPRTGTRYHYTLHIHQSQPCYEATVFLHCQIKERVSFLDHIRWTSTLKNFKLPWPGKERKVLLGALPEGRCSMEIILPPIQGTTLAIQSLFFNSTGSFESSTTPLGPETSSNSGICLAHSAFKKRTKIDLKIKNET